MKSIITFGVAMLAMTANAMSFGFSEIDTETGFGDKIPVNAKFSNEDTILHPSAYISSDYSKSSEETALDNNKVVDANDEVKAPLFFETSASEIKENNRIIDAQKIEYAPLDFKYINRNESKVSIPDALPRL
ncbi:hypothetical protein [Flavobacterium sp.]|uniref:hypothetical protein n=1 Tax=Flavobacterium sp. TaxID=239 RepID=UPI00122A6CA5|nr:hypothetical protein [Flavobacterium sp.]RZJ70770.1 MAG: hypothetical protein EOO49_13025 [Flavobacterium sp.]